MSWQFIVSLSMNAVFSIAIVFMYIVLRGIFSQRDTDISEYQRKDLTGREREEIRRKVLLRGIMGVTSADVLNLIYTFRSIELGQYEDTDVYVPDEPYDGLDEE